MRLGVIQAVTLTTLPGLEALAVDRGRWSPLVLGLTVVEPALSLKAKP